MINTIETWQAPKEVVVAIIDLALEHIKKVELNPEVETEGDNFDYWNSYDLGDGNYVDYNIYCGDGGLRSEARHCLGEYEYTDPSTVSLGMLLAMQLIHQLKIIPITK